MKRINRNQLAALLVGIQGNRFCNVLTSKAAKTLKKDRQTGMPFDGTIEIEGRYNGAIANIGGYGTMVNNRRIKEDKADNFVSMELPWGQWVESSKTLIEHKGNLYLRQYLVAASETHGVTKAYRLNGVATSAKALPDVLPAKRKSGGRQGLENPVIVVAHRLDSIVGLNIDGEQYEIVGEAGEAKAG
jgi:hypothetical protein